MDSISPDPSGSDTESTSSTPAPQTHSKEQSTFPLAHPPPKPSQRLRLTPKLLLQIQHLSPKSTRPLPVLEVWQPSRFAGRPCAKLSKLHGGDMYITQSESYASLSGVDGHNLVSEAEASHEAAVVVSVIYHAHAQKTKLKREQQAEVHFPLGGRTWTASVTAGGGYRFHGRDGNGKHVLEWKRRGTGKGERRSTSGSSSATDPAPGGDRARSRFVLAIVDVKTRRGVRVASLTKRGFEVGCWERLPRDALRECVGVGVASSTEAEAEAEAELSEGQLRTAVYTMILTMGVWVASQEGWLG